MFIKPGPGLKIRDPITRKFLADAGEEKPSDQYWHRRLLVGDVVGATPTDASSPEYVPAPAADAAPAEPRLRRRTRHAPLEEPK